jgi:hypothetical protein
MDQDALGAAGVDGSVRERERDHVPDMELDREAAARGQLDGLGNHRLAPVDDDRAAAATSRSRADSCSAHRRHTSVIRSSVEQSEQLFYTGRMERFPDVPCPRCQESAQLYTVPLKLLPASEDAWQALCCECFRGVLSAAPTDEQLMKPVQHARRSRRR